MKNFRRCITSTVMIAILLLQVSCSSLNKLVEAPRVSLTNVQLVDANLLEQRYRLTLRVQNPNPVRIPINGIDYAIKLAGIDFARGLTPEAFTLAARGEDVISIDVSTNLLESAVQIYNVIRQGPDSLDYNLSGNINVDLPFVKVLPFSRTGQVNLRQDAQ